MSCHAFARTLMDERGSCAGGRWRGLFQERRFSPKCANSSCRRSRRKGRSRRGLSTTRASRRKAFIRWGVARQYCGRLGKTDNCQIAVTLSIANHHASLPIAYRLYLPETWANDADRRDKAHVPEEVEFKTKPQIALAQIEAAMKDGVAPGVLLTDAG